MLSVELVDDASVFVVVGCDILLVSTIVVTPDDMYNSVVSSLITVAFAVGVWDEMEVASLVAPSDVIISLVAFVVPSAEVACELIGLVVS